MGFLSQKLQSHALREYSGLWLFSTEPNTHVIPGESRVHSYGILGSLHAEQKVQTSKERALARIAI